MLGRKPSAFCDKPFDRVVKTAFQVYMGTSWAQKLSDENLTFSCSDIERKVFTFDRKFFDWVVRSAFHLAIGLFWEEVSSLSFPLSFSDTEPKFFGILWVVYQLGCQNCILRVQKNSLSWISFAKVVEFCLSISPFQTKKSCFLAEKYRHVCQKCILTVRWNNLRGGFLWKSFLAILRDLAKRNFGFSSNKFLRGCQNCVLRAWGSILKTKTFLKMFHLFSQFRSVRGHFRVSVKNFSEGLSKLQSTCL